jgi:DNA invertase Pin-like site-specific DNA recombinase
MPQLKAAIYARKSTDQAGVADAERSVTRQVEHARGYAERRGWIVAEDSIFVDDGVSGAEFANRPGFLRLMNALKPKPPFQALIMSEGSRLGRETFETVYALKQLLTAGVRVFFYLEDRECSLQNPTDKLLFSVLGATDELERERAHQRTYDAIRRKAQAGRVTGGRTFGYDNVRDASGVRRMVNDREAAVVRRIFELAASGYGLTRIAKLLNDESAASPRAQQGRPAGWAPSSVREVLHRPLYRGEVLWNQSRKRDSWGVKRQAVRPEAEWLRIAAPELAIVSDALWTAAHAQMASQRERYSRSSVRGAPPWGYEPKCLLTGLLRCASCGSGMEARSRSHGSRRAVFYGCTAYHRRGTAVCRNAFVAPIEAAESAVLSAMEASLLHPRVLEAAVHRAVERLCSHQPRKGSSVAAALTKIEKELEHLTAAVAAGGSISRARRRNPRS